MAWPLEIEIVAKLLAREIYRKSNARRGITTAAAREEDERAEKSWVAYKEDATRIMSALYAAGWRPPVRTDTTTTPPA